MSPEVQSLEQRRAAARKKAEEYAGWLPTEWVTMTQATICIGGTSGRGNVGLVRAIEGCEIMRTVEIVRRGRARLVRRVAGVPEADRGCTRPEDEHEESDI